MYSTNQIKPIAHSDNEEGSAAQRNSSTRRDICGFITANFDDRDVDDTAHKSIQKRMVGGSHKYFRGTVAAFRLLLRAINVVDLMGAPNTKALQIYWGDRGSIQPHARHACRVVVGD